MTIWRHWCKGCGVKIGQYDGGSCPAEECKATVRVLAGASGATRETLLLQLQGSLSPRLKVLREALVALRHDELPEWMREARKLDSSLSGFAAAVAKGPPKPPADFRPAVKKGLEAAAAIASKFKVGDRVVVTDRGSKHWSRKGVVRSVRAPGFFHEIDVFVSDGTEGVFAPVELELDAGCSDTTPRAESFKAGDEVRVRLQRDRLGRVLSVSVTRGECRVRFREGTIGYYLSGDLELVSRADEPDKRFLEHLAAINNVPRRAGESLDSLRVRLASLSGASAGVGESFAAWMLRRRVL